MRHWFDYIGYRSRNRRVLAQLIVAVLAAGALAAIVIQRVHPPKAGDMMEDLNWTQFNPALPEGPTGEGPEGEGPLGLKPLSVYLANAKLAFEDVLDLLGDPSMLPPMDAAAVHADLAGSRFSDEQKAIAEALYGSVSTPGVEPQAELSGLMHADPAVRDAHFAAAVFYTHRMKLGTAAEQYEAEGRFKDATAARRRAMALYLRTDRIDDVSRLADDPAYADCVDSLIRLEVASHRQEWLNVVRYIVGTMVESYEPLTVGLAVFSGLFWFAYLLTAGEVRSFLSVRFALCCMGLGLGVLSVIPTLFLDAWQEQVLGLTASTELKQGLMYFLASVGLREELCKLLCFAPLAPWLVRRNKPIEWLIVAGCVGLGFAMEENVNYYFGSLGAAAGLRFVTANFFHITATALTGLALCHLILEPTKRAEDFLIVFFGVVVAHGLYDALGAVEILDEFSFMSIVIYLALVYQFFAEYARLRRGYRGRFDLTAIFALGLAFTIAAAFNYQVYIVGILPALGLTLPNLVQMGIILYWIVYRLDDDVIAM